MIRDKATFLAAKEALQTRFHLDEAEFYAFGSRLRPTGRKNDYDIMIKEARDSFPMPLLIRMKQYLKQAFPDKAIDLAIGEDTQGKIKL